MLVVLPALSAPFALLALAPVAPVAPVAPLALEAREGVFLRASQIGYLPGDPKIAVVFSDGDLPATFEVVDDKDHVVGRGVPTRPDAQRWGRFTAHGEIDVSSVRAPGRYRIRLPGADVESHPFRIGTDVFADAADTMLGFMRQQRCGYNPYLDTVCHRFDGRTADGPRPAGSFVVAHGGWHDAGDTLKYLITLATQGAMYERMTGSRTYRTFTARQRDWLFGTNPWGTTMFTGIGVVSPADVHIPAFRLGKAMVAGGLVDGPVQESIFASLRGVTLSRPDRFALFQSSEAVYHDDWQDYSTNEPTMDGTASAILLMAMQKGGSQAAPTGGISRRGR